MTDNMKEYCEGKPEEGIENTKNEGEKLFTQKELEEIISERLKRERKTNEALYDVKRLLKTACEKGIIGGNSYSEMAKDFCKKLTLGKAGAEDQNVDASGLPENTPTHIQEETNVMNDHTAEKEEASVADGDETQRESGKTEEPKEEQDERKAENFVRVLSELKEQFSGEDIAYLLGSGLFESYAKGRSGSTVDVFKDFCSFMTALNKNVVDDKDKSYENDFADEICSTAFSSLSGGGTSYDECLTKQQMDIAKSAGMSYREYAELLDSIPKNKTRKNYNY